MNKVIVLTIIILLVAAPLYAAVTSSSQCPNCLIGKLQPVGSDSSILLCPICSKNKISSQTVDSMYGLPQEKPKTANSNSPVSFEEEIGGKKYILPATFIAKCSRCGHEEQLETALLKTGLDIRCNECGKYKCKPVDNKVLEYWNAARNEEKKDEIANRKDRKRIENERRKYARQLGIGAKLLTLCPNCKTVVYLEQLVALDIYEGTSTREVICGSCSYAYDIADGIDYYNAYVNQANQAREQNAAVAMQYTAMNMQAQAQQQQNQAAQNQTIMNLVHHDNGGGNYVPLPAGSTTTSYRTIGNTLYGSDGASYRTIGNTVYGSDGTSYRTIGDTVYGSDGTSYRTIGDTVYRNDGTSYRTIGNTLYGSDGSTAQKIGNTTYVKDNK